MLTQTGSVLAYELHLYVLPSVQWLKSIAKGEYELFFVKIFPSCIYNLSGMVCHNVGK